MGSVIFGFSVLEEMMKFSKYLRQKLVNCQVFGLIFSSRFFALVLHSVLETKVFPSLLLHENIHGFLQLEGINLLMVTAFLLG